MSEYKFVVPGRLVGLNEYTKANRSGWKQGNREKRNAQEIVGCNIRQQLHRVQITNPVFVNFKFTEPNKKRDHDNVASFATKVVFDALVQCGVLKDDGWDEVLGYSVEFEEDKENPHIEITIKEVIDEQSESANANH